MKPWLQNLLKEKCFSIIDCTPYQKPPFPTYSALCSKTSGERDTFIDTWETAVIQDLGRKEVLTEKEARSGCCLEAATPRKFSQIFQMSGSWAEKNRKSECSFIFFTLTPFCLGQKSWLPTTSCYKLLSKPAQLFSKSFGPLFPLEEAGSVWISLLKPVS